MSSTLNLKFCPKCGERLSYTSFEGYCAIADCLWNNDECTPPGHEDQSARLAASAEVGQVGGTITFKELLPALTEFGIAALYGYALGLALVLWTLKEVGA